MKRLVMLLCILMSGITAFSQIPNVTPAVRSVTKAEYFFEVDPGVGHGFPINSFIAADTVTFSANIPISTLAPGFHILQIRVSDTTGFWSLSEPRFFYLSSDSSVNTSNITAAEYFIDADPGPGKGTPASIGTAGATVNFTVLIPTNLSPGFHFLAIRARDANGRWGFSDTRNFYLAPPPEANMASITAAEYFYDNDPGAGKGMPLVITTPGDVVTQAFMIPVAANMAAGDHLLAIRVRDANGNWSLFDKDTLTVGTTAASITCPHDTIVTAPAGQCTATVNNIDPMVSPQGSSYTYTLSGATAGNGTGTASGHTFNAGVTTVTYALTSSPSISCSFNVTVNTNVVPLVSIVANPVGAICPGTSVTFTATPINGGATPTYQWKVNGNVVGTGSSFQSSTLANGDKISCVMTSSAACANPTTATSNEITMAITSSVTPSVSIAASPTGAICAGTNETFTASPTNGGATPTYQWKVNGNVVGTGSSFQSSTIANGDKITCVMTSSAACVNPTTATSNEITMAVNPSLIPSVSIVANPEGTICSGTNVTFTPTPINGGSTPVYEWTLNNNAVGTNSSTYQTSTLNNGDVVRLTMSSSASCADHSPVYSNAITITVGTLTPSVSISTASNTFCPGQQVTFVASPINGGSNPVYEWTLNNNAVGSDSDVYQTSTLRDGDVVRVTMSSSASCANRTPVYSNSITMTAGTVTPSVTIAASDSAICSGTLVTFTATPTNGGTNPHYEWTVNGIELGTNSNVYQSSSLSNGDTVKVYMTSSNICASPSWAVSNRITMSVNQSVTPSVTIAAATTTACSGTTVTFTATPTNGGIPSYQWMVNGNNVGTNSPTYQNSALANGDSVAVYMTSSLGCANPKSVKSNVVVMTVTPSSTFYADLDGDGYGNSGSGTVQGCAAPAGYVVNNSDCDDHNAAVHPGATEICGNGIDDNCDGTVDENCNVSASLPVIILRTYPVKEGDAGLTTLNVTVALDRPATAPVTMHYSTVNGDAIAGMDYVATSGSLKIPVGDSTGTIQLKIIGDLLRESNERFTLHFSDPVNVDLGPDPNSRIMIIDDDKGKISNTITQVDRSAVKEQSLKIPSVAKRNHVWVIPEIGNYENEILLLNTQGQLVNRYINYRNQSSLSNVASGLYFYRIRIEDGSGQVKYYSGRLLITE